MFFFPLSPLLDSIFFEYTTLSFIAALLFLTLLSLCFIFHLRFKSHTLHHLQNFNSLWFVRFILVSFITLWGLNELLRLPFFCKQFLYPIFPSLTESNHANLCKIQVVLSLGFFEPAFLVTLLFLVNLSIKQKTTKITWAFPFVLITCLPIFTLQILFVFLTPNLPGIFTRSYVVSKDDSGNDMVFCRYPLLSTIVFCGFGIGYSLCFLFSCWKVVSLVINKALRVRIYGLAFTVLISLPVQVVSLGLSMLRRPEEAAYGGFVLIVFISTFLCAAVGEGILVIIPIIDTLAAGGDCCRWNPGCPSRREEIERNLVGGELQLV